LALRASRCWRKDHRIATRIRTDEEVLKPAEVVGADIDQFESRRPFASRDLAQPFQDI
jgi:hypothetical protein